jgi:hypothetical protein
MPAQVRQLGMLAQSLELHSYSSSRH